MNLSNNKLSNGDELSEFLSKMPNLSQISLANNNFGSLPAQTFSKNKITALDMGKILDQSETGICYGNQSELTI